MAKISRNFTEGKMNKVLDERIVPQGQYIDALNIRMGSTEQAEIGVIENSKGNTLLTALQFNGVPLSSSATTIGAIANGEKETVYWFVHDPNFPVSPEAPLGKIDMIVSFNESTNILRYHIVSVYNGNSVDPKTWLNFNPQYLITGINIIDDLIFFTDDFNQPRFFDVNKSYPLPVGGLDLFNPESILVIKRPPVESPEVVLTTLPNQENYLEERFVCFAYRYEYENNQYSAISQFSAPAFFPKPFDFTDEAFLNEGMVNEFNAARVTVKTGGPLVKSIDLLFKDMNSNVIKVIEKVNKAELGLSDNSDYTYTFSNSKIFTILPEAELLRLYDNVPLRAKAQTIMGNRLMYGNYVEGYDLVDRNGNPTMLEYDVEGISESIGLSSLNNATSIVGGQYTINGVVSISDCAISIDFTGVDLVAGAIINVDFTFSHAAFSGGPFPSDTTSPISTSFYYQLPFDYASIADVVASIEFQDTIGTALNILPVYDPLNPAVTPCDGYTFTDTFNCLVPSQLDTYTKYASGISVGGQPITVTAVGDIMTIQLVAMQFVDDLLAPITSVYEYYKVTSVDVTYSQRGDTKSLHSNRDYEIGIVYMDEFNRSTTALVSPRNTVHFPCGTSPLKNSIRVTIPPTQVAPSWATRYKFVIKPDKAGYETIYSDIYFQDPSSNSVYLLLQGENARKVEVGDRYIVKADATGPKQSCSYATVLEKEAKLSGFLGFTQGPTGVYMKMNANDFVVSNDANSKITPGQLQSQDTSSSDNYPAQVNYPMNLEPSTPGGMYTDYTVPEGSIFRISIVADRRGTGNSACEKIRWVVDMQFTATADYANMHEFFVQQNIFETIKQEAENNGLTEPTPPNNPKITYDTSIISGPGFPSFTTKNFLQFARNITTNQLKLIVTGGERCSGFNQPENRKSVLTVNASVFRATVNLIFETIPVDALPDVFYENELSLPIGPYNDPVYGTLTEGEHGGNVQNQNFGTNTPAIIDTGFFNCYTFGNGVESYKIRDSIIGRTLELGNRVTSVAAQDYQQVDRFADITYSGIFSNESNVNRLNEFNAGLLNFKNCEQSFGPIYILDGRQTDVLTLQEDKVSYVLAGKNLLSDAAAGGAISSVPEVLGTQIARSEDYGISFNPESYVQYGYDRFFTDAKRGSVIQIKGDSYSSDQLNVISDMGMDTWFRDLFIGSFTTQKLGGFDPYLNEYVLSSNNIQIPQPVECIECGIAQTLTFEEASQVSFCVNVGLEVGPVDISYRPYGVAPSDFEIIATYNGNTYTTGIVSSAGTLTVPKDVNNIKTIEVQIISTGPLILDVNAACVNGVPITIVEVVVTNNYEAGKTIHAEYRYTKGTYASPLQSSYVTFGSDPSNFVVSRYNTNIGFAGAGAFPDAGSLVKMITNQYPTDTFVFDPADDRMKYLMSNVLYGNNTAAITNLLSAAIDATPSVTSASYNEATFIVPPLQSYLYLVWDLRDSVETSLCFSSTSQDVCCNCNTCAEACKSFLITNVQAPSVEVQYLPCRSLVPTTIIVDENKSVVICTDQGIPPFIVSGVADITIYNDCGC